MSGNGVSTEGDVTVDVGKVLVALIKMSRVDLSPTMAIVAEMLVADVAEQFQTAGGGKWPDLADSTKAKRRGKSYRILQDTGRFAASVQAFSGRTYAEASTDVSYAVFHCSLAPRSVIPYRNPFDLPEEASARAMDTITSALVADMMQAA